MKFIWFDSILKVKQEQSFYRKYETNRVAVILSSIHGHRIGGMEYGMNQKMTASTTWEEIGISNDFMFGKVMQQPELCRGLLQRILPDLQIDRIEYPEAQKGIRADVDAKSVRLDVYIKDGKGTVYDIEMQVTDTGELPKRTRYYQSLIDLQLIDKGEAYRKLKPSYIIFICPFDLFEQGRHIYTFVNTCQEDGKTLLEDGTTKIFLNTDSEMDDVSESLRAFLDYVAGKRPEDDFVNRLEEAVRVARKNREWRHEYMTLLMRDQENIEKGIEKGKIEGRAEEIIETGYEYGLSEEAILERLQRKLDMSLQTAKEYLKKFRKQTV